MIKDMKFLLIRPPFAVEKFYFPRFINESLAVESLAPFLRQKHEVEIIDCVAEGWNNYWQIPEYSQLFFQGMQPEKLLKKIVDFQPQIIGLTWSFPTQNDSIQQTLKLIRQYSQSVPVVVGGPEPSGNPKKTLTDFPDIDIIVYGEGEVTMQEILDNQAKNLEKIKGIAFRKDGQILINSARDLITNLDALPLPDRQSLPHDNYSKQNLYQAFYLRLKKIRANEKKNIKLAGQLSSLPGINRFYYRLYNQRNRRSLPTADIVSARGCPYHCTFCAIHTTWGHRWRMRSAQNVLAEIDLLVNKFGIQHINIQDDNFNVSKERAIAICQGIVKNKYNLTIEAPAFIANLDEETLTWFKRAGMHYMRLSIESGNQDILHNVIKKNINLDKVKPIVDICRKLGIYTEGVFMFGVPGETVETMKQSLEFAKKVGFDGIVRFIYQPFPNTELYDICVKNNYLTPDYDPRRVYVTGNKCYVKTDKFSPQDVLKIVNR